RFLMEEGDATRPEVLETFKDDDAVFINTSLGSKRGEVMDSLSKITKESFLFAAVGSGSEINSLPVHQVVLHHATIYTPFFQLPFIVGIPQWAQHQPPQSGLAP